MELKETKCGIIVMQDSGQKHNVVSPFSDRHIRVFIEVWYKN